MLAVDATTVYFVDGTNVFAAPRAGGPTRLLVEDELPFDAGCVAVYGARVLYVAGSEIKAVPVGGGAVKSSEARGYVVDRRR